MWLADLSIAACPAHECLRSVIFICFFRVYPMWSSCVEASLWNKSSIFQHRCPKFSHSKNCHRYVSSIQMQNLQYLQDVGKDLSLSNGSISWHFVPAPPTPPPRFPFLHFNLLCCLGPCGTKFHDCSLLTDASLGHLVYAVCSKNSSTEFCRGGG